MGLIVLGQSIESGTMWYGFTYPDSVHLVTEDINSGYGSNHYEGSFLTVGTPFSILNYFMSKYEGNLNNFVHDYDGQVYGEAWDSNGQPTTFIPGQYPIPTFHFCMGYWYDATHNSVHFFGGFQQYGNNAVVSRMHNDLGYHGMSLTSGPNDTDRAMASLYFFKPQEAYQPDLTLGHQGDATYTPFGTGYRCAVNGVYSVQKRRWELFNNNVTGFSADIPLMGPVTLMTTQYFGGNWYGPRPSGAPMPAPDYYGWFYGYERADYPGYNGPYYDVTNMGDIIEETEDEPEPAPPEIDEDGEISEFKPQGGGGGRKGFKSGSISRALGQVPMTGAPDSGFVYMYQPTHTQLISLAQWLWSDDFIDNIKQVNSNAMDCIQNIMFIPMDVQHAQIGVHTNNPKTVCGADDWIRCGNLQSPVQARYIREGYAEVNFTITMDKNATYEGEQYGTCLDYNPYTTIQMFLPFIGTVQLDPTEVFSPRTWSLHEVQIKIQYLVNLYNGNSVARIFIDRPLPDDSMSNSDGATYAYLLGQYDTNIGFSIPASGANYNNYYKDKINGISGIVGGVANIAMGGAMAATGAGAMAGAGMIGGGIAQVGQGLVQTIGAAPQMTKGGCSSGGSAPMSVWEPYLEVIRPAKVSSKDVPYAKMNAWPTNDYCAKIKDLYKANDLVRSYAEFTNVIMDNFKGTDEEKDELIATLKNGVYVNTNS